MFELNFTLNGIAWSRRSNSAKFLRKFESIFKTALAHEAWHPGVPFNEKTEGQRSRDTVPSSEEKLGMWNNTVTLDLIMLYNVHANRKILASLLSTVNL
jgi:hypothetical protein